MIKVEVRLYATLRRYTPHFKIGEALELDFKDGSTVKHIYERLNMRIEEVKRVIVNGIARDNEYVLSNGDRVAIFPPVAGG